jgi:hypothetical protein
METLENFIKLMNTINSNQNFKTTELIYMYLSLLNKIRMWQTTGSKTFKLSKDLVEAFNHTDINLNCTPNDFQYPFGCFMIESEDPMFDVFFSDGRKTSVYNILYINKQTASKLLKPVNIYGHIQNVEWDISISAIVPGIKMLDIETGLDYIWLNLKNNNIIKEMYEKQIHPISIDLDLRITKNETQSIVNIFYNTIMYINERVNDNSVQKIRTRKINVGNSKNKITNSYIYLTTPKSYKSLTSSEHRTIDKRFIVRGHWTHQVYGEKLSLRRKQWILPYWKGPELSEIISKPYKVN